LQLSSRAAVLTDAVAVVQFVVSFAIVTLCFITISAVVVFAGCQSNTSNTWFNVPLETVHTVYRGC